LPQPPTEKEKQLIAILEIVRIEELVGLPHWRGRPPADRPALARAFVAKAVYNLPTTKLLVHTLRAEPNLRALCGFARLAQVPAEATFSRAFDQFATSELLERVHQALVRQHLGEELIGHLSRDSTEVEAREKAAPKPQPEPVAAPRRGRGRPRKGSAPPPPPTPTCLEQQLTQTAEQAFAQLPTDCAWGAKRDAKGCLHFWKGYKTHLDVMDCGLPVTAFTTGANVHDSQVAIPLARRSAARVTALYELMDSAYDAAPIDQLVRELGQVPIIARNRRRGDSRPPLEPARQQRCTERTTVERVYARLKDEFGGRQVRVRGHRKVHAHMMFGVVALFADQLLKLVT
jgi:hypothetical protein